MPRVPKFRKERQGESRKNWAMKKLIHMKHNTFKIQSLSSFLCIFYVIIVVIVVIVHFYVRVCAFFFDKCKNFTPDVLTYPLAIQFHVLTSLRYWVKIAPRAFAAPYFRLCESLVMHLSTTLFIHVFWVKRGNFCWFHRASSSGLRFIYGFLSIKIWSFFILYCCCFFVPFGPFSII